MKPSSKKQATTRPAPEPPLAARCSALFCGQRMTWARTLLFAAVCGIAVGVLMIPDALDNTSLQNPGTYPEFWVLFALVIALNCPTALDAACKVFAAFVISQPLIYLVQVPFGPRGWQIFSYYPRWIVPTLLTFPAALLAWQLKKKTKWSVVILSVANLLLAALLVYFGKSTLRHFPHNLLSVLFCAAEIIVFTLTLLPTKKQKTIAFAVAALGAVGAFFVL